MARVTVEDCIDKVENRFELVLLASHRARLISSGSPLTVDRDRDKNPVVALREIAGQSSPRRRVRTYPLVFFRHPVYPARIPLFSNQEGASSWLV